MESQGSLLSAQFLQKYSSQLTKATKQLTPQNINAKIWPDHPQYIDHMGQCIRNGQLVAFPTQTVYGLGADATNQLSLHKIYQTKKRPLTDPIIAHVLGYDHALPLVKFTNSSEKELFKQLTQKFWPGPLTIILKANLEQLPSVITAQTGFVGIRSPKHPYARKLLEAAQRPIGAPSANLFSHVSPTSSVHVFNDFYDQPINIVDSGRCEYGIESTVIKLSEGKIEVLRQGSLQTQKLKQFIKSIGQKFQQQLKVQVIRKVKEKSKQNEGMESPGQLLKHYAPYLPCYSTDSEQIRNSRNNQLKKVESGDTIGLRQVALIVLDDEFEDRSISDKIGTIVRGQDMNENSDLDLQGEDIFCSREQKNKMKNLYYLLRKAENLEVKAILILWDSEKAGTIWDKVFRATQGLQAQIQ